MFVSCLSEANVSQQILTELSRLYYLTLMYIAKMADAVLCLDKSHFH